MARDTTKARLREIRRLYDRDMLVSTVVAARRFLAEHPKRSIAWLRLGDSLRAMARFPEALSALRKALRLCPDDKRDLVCHFIGKAHDDRGAFRLAERWYRRAIELRPAEASWHIPLGGMFARRGRLREAEAVHRQATRCKEGCVDEAFLNLGLVLRAQERYAEARRCFRRALALDPKYRAARRELADVEHVLLRLRTDWRHDRVLNGPAPTSARRRRRRRR